MDAVKSCDFSGCVSGNAGMCSWETGCPTLTEIDEKLVLDEALSQNERHARISDLVWCKAMSQPWWPGKVVGDSMMLTDSDEPFDSDIYLVECYGDRSIAWHDISCLKPFWENFPILAKRSDAGFFRNAVDCALEEISRRIKYSLSCRCMPKQIYEDVGRPFWGMGCDKREAVLSTTSFVPRDLVYYLQASSAAASGADNKLALKVVIAQLSAFFCWRNRFLELPKNSSQFAAQDSDLHVYVSKSSMRKDDDIMDFYWQDQCTSAGSFPSSQNALSMGRYPAYVTLTANDLPSPAADNRKGKFPAESDNSGDISTPIIPMEELADHFGESEEKYATSLHMIFTEWNSVPTEAKLHETFGQFGQLIESETKRYPKSMAARIVFQERSAAEAASGIVRETLPAVVSFKLKLLCLRPVKSSRGRKRQR